MDTGDGWTFCSLGHRHWGRFGAAGLLITDGARVILQHRAPWTHEGGSWGVPGGARGEHETPFEAAEREAFEEAALPTGSVRPLRSFIADHGGWSYTTVVAGGDPSLRPHAANAESVSIDWVDIAEVSALPLHRGFALAWPDLHRYVSGSSTRPPEATPLTE